MDRHGDVWFHDGMKTGTNLVPEGNVLNLDSSMFKTAGKRCVSVLVYTKMWSRITSAFIINVVLCNCY